MIGRVPLARRALFQDRRRAVLAAGGVAAALLLVLMLQGIFDGAMRQTTAYLRHLPADVIVSQEDVRTMHMSVSSLPANTRAAVERVAGVDWAEDVFYTTTVVTGPDDRQLSYVIGYDPTTGRAGPRTLSRGVAPGPGEIVLDEIAADRLGVGVGDRVTVFGDTLRVSGLFRGGTSIVNSVSFVTADDFVARRGPSVAYVIVGARPDVSPSELEQRLDAALSGVTVQTRSQFVDQEASLVADMSADVMRIMSVIAFLIALAVIGLTLFSLTLAKLREHAVVKALGGRDLRLAAVVVAQATYTVALALGLAVIVAIGLARIVGTFNPAINIVIRADSVLRAALGALVIGALGAIVPLRRVTSVDPASAFGSAP